MDKALHQGKWDKKIGRLLSEKQVALIGYGNIGRKVAALLSAFDAELVIVDPRFSGSVDNHKVLDLPAALKKADIVTLLCSGEDCLLGEKEFSLMKQGVYVLNAARGSLVDESSLKQALDNKKVLGAWLDTFEQEPYKGDLGNYPQVVLTPHVGSYAFECRQKMEMETVDNLLDCFTNQK